MLIEKLTNDRIFWQTNNNFKSFDALLDSLVPTYVNETGAIIGRNAASVQNASSKAEGVINAIVAAYGPSIIMDFIDNWPEERSQNSAQFIYPVASMMQILTKGGYLRDKEEWLNNKRDLLYTVLENYHLPALKQKLLTGELGLGQYFHEMFRLQILFTERMRDYYEVVQAAHSVFNNSLQLSQLILQLAKINDFKPGDEVNFKDGVAYIHRAQGISPLFIPVGSRGKDILERIMNVVSHNDECWEFIKGHPKKDEFTKITALGIVGWLKRLATTDLKPEVFMDSIAQTDLAWQIVLDGVTTDIDALDMKQKNKYEDLYSIELSRKVGAYLQILDRKISKDFEQVRKIYAQFQLRLELEILDPDRVEVMFDWSIDLDGIALAEE